MKKTLLVVALAAVLVFAFASVAMAKNAGSPAVGSGGFITWPKALSLVTVNAVTGVDAATQAAQEAGPHANYTANTIKCNVCHSVHGAPANTFLLTKVTGAQSGTSASVVCSYCHGVGATASTKIVSLTIGSSTSPHSGRCAAEPGCHAPSPHGVGASAYPVLSSRLLNNGADTVIAKAIAESADSGVNADTFSTAPAGEDFTRPQITLATGYLCASTGCHNNSAFAIGARGNNMYTQQGGSAGPAGYRSGHPVLATANADWAEPAGSAFGTAPKAIAWADANGCEDCHDLQDAARGGATAFPHNTLGSRLWMTKASDASRSDATTLTGDLLYSVTAVDGTCIKCHVSTDGTQGVGEDF